MNLPSHRPLAVQLHFFDPTCASEADWRRLHAYRRQRAEEDFPGEPQIGDSDFEADLRTHRPLSQSQRILALHGDAIVGNLILGFRRPGSPGSEDFAEFIDVWGGVARAQRRRGVATALLAGLADFMASLDKRVATFKTMLPEGHACLEAIGAHCKLRMAENRLALGQLDWEALRHWASLPHAAASALRWEIHTPRVPFEVLEGLIEPLSALINQQPLGSLEIPRIRYELQAYRDWYADMDRRGGEHFLVLLRDGAEVAAVCDASWDQRFPDRAYQQLTAVSQKWRGRGLAKAVKARMLSLLRERLPRVDMVQTFNAQANAAMLSINHRLGFSQHREEATWQIDLAGLRRYGQRAAQRPPHAPG